MKHLTVGDVRAALRDYDDDAPAYVQVDHRQDRNAVMINLPVVALINDEGEPTILGMDLPKR